jgi:predicted acylesterase/phospholipase RssA
MCWHAIAAVIGFWSIDMSWRSGSIAAAMSTVAVGKSMVHRVTRRIMLTYIGVSTAPLSRRLSQIIEDDQVARMKRSRTRLYGTLSCLRNRKNVQPEWVPRYVRLDRMKREDLIETLVAGAGFPGLSDTRGLDETIVDGGWSDNIPIAPFLFDQQNAVDVVIVINTGNESVGLSKETATPESLKQWASTRWRKLHPHARTVDPELPEIIWVTPSVSIGGFYSGTCAFSPKKSPAMMALGEKDMAAALKEYNLDR